MGGFVGGKGESDVGEVFRAIKKLGIERDFNIFRAVFEQNIRACCLPNPARFRIF